MPSKGPGSPVGYHYKLGFILVKWGCVIDKSIKILVDGDKVLWEGNATDEVLTISKPYIFGGDEKEGGVSGKLALHSGIASQDRDEYLVSVLGPTISAYRYLAHVVSRRMYIGNHYYLKNWSFLDVRVNKLANGAAQWEPAYASPLTNQLNPIHIIRECLTDKHFGFRKEASQINDVNFLAAAITCYNEGLGYSFRFKGSTEALIKEVQSHMNGRVYQNPTTGKYEILLIRDDYDANAIMYLDEDHIQAVTKVEPASIEDLYNTVSVKFWNRDTLKDDEVTVTNRTLINRQKAVTKKTLDFKGITFKTLAIKTAQREARVLGTPLSRHTIVTDTFTKNLIPGNVIKWSWKQLGIVNHISRISEINLGDGVNNKITIELVTDVFAATDVPYFIDPDTQWDDVITDPVDLTTYLVTETPYYLYAKMKGDTEAQAVASTTNFISVAADQPSGDSFKAEVYIDDGGGYEHLGVMFFCPVLTLNENLSLTDTTLTILYNEDVALIEIGEFIQCGTELMRVDSITETSIVVGRGVLDTVPTTHSIGDKIYGWQIRNGYINKEYLEGENLNVKFLTTTSRGILDIANATAHPYQTTNRFHRPYPPGKPRVNGLQYPTTVTGTINVSWTHRNRLQQTVSLIDQEYGSIGPEAGTTYNIRLYDGAILKREQLNYSGTSYDLIPNNADPLYNTSMPNARIEIESIRGGITSWQKQVISFSYGP